MLSTARTTAAAEAGMTRIVGHITLALRAARQISTASRGNRCDSFVLISSVPQLAARNSLNLSVLTQIVIVLLEGHAVSLFTGSVPSTDVLVDQDLRSRNCALLC